MTPMIMRSQFSIARLGLAVLVVAILLPVAGCTRYKTWYKNDFRPVERPNQRTLPMYTTEGPVAALPFARISSRRSKNKTERNVAKQLEDIEKAARRMDADAVYNIRILPVRQSGYEPDPNTPFPSVRGGEWIEFVLIGDAMVYPLREESLRVGLAWEEAITTETNRDGTRKTENREPEAAELKGSEPDQQASAASIIAEAENPS